jgi:hypothetical protein
VVMCLVLDQDTKESREEEKRTVQQKEILYTCASTWKHASVDEDWLSEHEACIYVHFIVFLIRFLRKVDVWY